MSQVKLRFLPWMRRGLATQIATSTGVQSSASQVSLSVRAAGKTITQAVRVRGPGHVIGIDRREILRCEPADGSTSFEPNYFPHVEFASADLPWRYTPGSPSGDKLRPWLILVVVRRQPGVQLRPGNPLPVLEIAGDADARNELPPLAESWAWGHVQVAVAAGDTRSQADLYEQEPGRFVSRLMCPRRLDPESDYLACLVPAFDAGRDAGLGSTDADPDQLGDAWSSDDRSVRLPVYWSWSFRTSAVGDFEELARRLDPRVLGASVGARPLDVSDPGSGLPITAGAETAYMGALISAAAKRWWKPRGAQSKLRDGLRGELERDTGLRDDDRKDGSDREIGDPVVSPPMYGARVHRAEALDNRAPVWMRQLNLDPANRAAAGLGAEVVRRNQEDLMAGAWDQAAALKDASKAIRQTRFAGAVGGVLAQRIAKLEDGALLQITRPMHGRAKSSARPRSKRALAGGKVATKTAHAHVLAGRAPKSMVSPAFRRIARRGGAADRGSRSGAKPNLGAGLLTQTVVDGQLGFASLRVVAQPSGIKLYSDAAVGKRSKTKRAKASTTRRVAPAGITPVKSPIPSSPDLRLATAARTIRETLASRSAADENLRARIKGLSSWKRGAPVPAAASFDPSFDEPLYEDLRDIDSELLCPGIAGVPDDTVGLLEVNPAFVASYLTGVNHEFAGELLWREFPADLRATFFQRFWDTGDEGDVDIAPLARWPKNRPLAKCLDENRGAGTLVLLIRGELIRRYPDAVFYAMKARWAGTRRREPVRGTELDPVFHGHIDEATIFVGFDLDETEARGSVDSKKNEPGWFFVIEQQPTAPRFGLDVSRDSSDPSWAQVPRGHSHASPQGVPLKASLSSVAARNSYQRPIRFFYHADGMLPRAEE